MKSEGIGTRLMQRKDGREANVDRQQQCFWISSDIIPPDYTTHQMKQKNPREQATYDLLFGVFV